MPAKSENEPLVDTLPNGIAAPKTKAFISAPAGVDTHVLRQVLARRGIASFFADEVNFPGGSIAEVLQEGMAEADLVIGVIDAQRDNSNVFFELGFALGQHKRVLVLSPTHEVLPGIALTGMSTIRATPQDADKIEFGLRQILAAPRKKEPFRRPEKQTHPIGEVADQLLGEISPDQASNRLEEIVRKALTEGGITTLSAGQGGAHLAVWSDDWEPWVSNPLLIEIKSKLRGPAELENAIDRVIREVASRGTAWGLLLYGGSLPPPLEKRLKGAPILAISLENFLRALKTEGFADLVRRLRNERVHGRE